MESFTYYIVICGGIVWSLVELAAREPFDAFILFTVTLSFYAYRLGIKSAIGESDESKSKGAK